MTALAPPARRRRDHAHPVGDVARRERQAREVGAWRGLQALALGTLLLGLMFGVPLALGALAVAFGMDPLGGVR